jgi:hypothetical protein
MMLVANCTFRDRPRPIYEPKRVYAEERRRTLAINAGINRKVGGTGPEARQA